MPDLGEFKKVDTKETIQATPPTQETKAIQATNTDESEPKINTSPSVTEVKSDAKPISTSSPKPKAAVKPKAKPRRAGILFEQSTHDFGEITEGDIIKHKFKFKNTGNAELVIKSATASCGCTDPSYPFLGIPPGEEGFIGVSYNSVSKDGPQKPEVIIKTNASDHAYVLYLKGDVVPKKKEDEVTEKKDSSGISKNN